MYVNILSSLFQKVGHNLSVHQDISTLSYSPPDALCGACSLSLDTEIG